MKKLIVIGIVLVLLVVGLSGCTEDKTVDNDEVEPGDTDGDGYNDDVDYFPQNADEWADGDGDNIGDNSDAFPDDASEWLDSDDDGHGDNSDDFPNQDVYFFKELMISNFLSINSGDDNVTINVGTVDFGDEWDLQAKRIIFEGHLDSYEGDFDFPIGVTFDYIDSFDVKKEHTFYITRGDRNNGYEASIEFSINIYEDTPLNMTISKLDGFTQSSAITLHYSIYQVK